MTRLLAQGESIQIWQGKGTPAGFTWHGTPHRIEEVCGQWQVHTRWWEPCELVWRAYLKVTTNTGLLCQIYQDVPSEKWFLSRLYD
jgi:hypothetical protein